MFRLTALCVVALTACSGVSAQSRIDPVHSGLYQDNAPPSRPATPHPRIDVAAGLTAVNLRKLPADSSVGGLPAGLFASAGYFWTPYLVTQVEIVSQVEEWNPDYALEYVVSSFGGGSFELKTVQLKHNYVGGRRTVAQIVQIGTRKVRPYFGAGVGIEVQTIHDSRQEYSRPLLQRETPPDNAKTVDEFPTEFPRPTETHSVIAFAQAHLPGGARLRTGGAWREPVGWVLANPHF